jgi:hypothetical protein
MITLAWLLVSNLLLWFVSHAQKLIFSVEVGGGGELKLCKVNHSKYTCGMDEEWVCLGMVIVSLNSTKKVDTCDA